MTNGHYNIVYSQFNLIAAAQDSSIGVMHHIAFINFKHLGIKRKASSAVHCYFQLENAAALDVNHLGARLRDSHPSSPSE